MRPDADDMFKDNATLELALGASVQGKIAFGESWSIRHEDRQGLWL